MKNQFLLFQKKARRDIRLKAAVVGISAALLVSGVLLLAAKMLLWPTWYSLIGIAALPIGTGLFLLLHRVGEKKLAQRMDEDFALHEKVQTMIAFQNSDDPMACVQRQDTMEKLNQIPVKKLRFVNLWVYILLPVIASAMMITALACPEKVIEPEPEPYEPPRQITEWEWQALDELIEYVRNSEADAEIMKPKTLSELEALRELLTKGVSESSLSLFVNATITNIRNVHVQAAERTGITERQLELNAEVCDYTIEQLCIIFGLNVPEDPDEPEDPTDGPTQDDDNKPNDNQTGTDDVSMATDDLIFDAKQGYVQYKYVFNDYLSELNNALEEGTISKEEWSEFMLNYFNLLATPNKDE